MTTPGEKYWAEQVRTQDPDYSRVRAHLLEAPDPAAEFKGALTHQSPRPVGPDERKALLVLDDIASSRPDIVFAVIREVFWWAQSLNPYGGVARHALAEISDLERLDQALRPLIREFLSDSSKDWQDHRGAAMLLDDLGLDELLDSVREVAMRSMDLDTREIADDFPSHHNTAARWRPDTNNPIVADHSPALVKTWNAPDERTSSTTTLRPQDALWAV